MSLIRPDLLHLFVHVNGAAGTVISGGLPDSAVVRNGAGDWTITLPADQGMDINNGLPVVTVLGAVPLLVSVLQSTDLIFQVLFEDDAGAATDANFKLLILKLESEG